MSNSQNRDQIFLNIHNTPTRRILDSNQYINHGNSTFVNSIADQVISVIDRNNASGSSRIERSYNQAFHGFDLELDMIQRGNRPDNPSNGLDTWRLFGLVMNISFFTLSHQINQKMNTTHLHHSFLLCSLYFFIAFIRGGRYEDKDHALGALFIITISVIFDDFILYLFLLIIYVTNLTLNILRGDFIQFYVPYTIILIAFYFLSMFFMLIDGCKNKLRPKFFYTLLIALPLFAVDYIFYAFWLLNSFVLAAGVSFLQIVFLLISWSCKR